MLNVRNFSKVIFITVFTVMFLSSVDICFGGSSGDQNQKTEQDSPNFRKRISAIRKRIHAILDPKIDRVVDLTATLAKNVTEKIVEQGLEEDILKFNVANRGIKCFNWIGLMESKDLQECAGKIASNKVQGFYENYKNNGVIPKLSFNPSKNKEYVGLLLRSYKSKARQFFK